MSRRQALRAFTLPELLIALSVLGIILSTGVPALNNLLQSNRHDSARHLLYASLNYARGTAIQSRKMVTLCAGDSRCADSRHWSTRILIFVDNNGNGTLDNDERLLRTVDLDPSLHWHWSNFRQQPYMSFRANGMTDSLNGTFTLCDGDAAIHASVINITGRTREGSHPDHERCQE